MAKTKSRLPTYSLLAIFLLTAALYGGFALWYEPAPESTRSVASSIGSIGQVTYTADDPWPLIYPNTKAMKIGDVPVQASIAETWPERIRGLSKTPYLPRDVVKLFIFDSPGYHSIWMKDMNYPIDIIWVDDNLEIVHIEESVTPETYPNLFVPDVPARYVIETASGFVKEHKITESTLVTLPSGY